VDPIEAIRLRANRLFVIRRGNVIASSPEATSLVRLGEREETVGFRNCELPDTKR